MHTFAYVYVESVKRAKFGKNSLFIVLLLYYRLGMNQLKGLSSLLLAYRHIEKRIFPNVLLLFCLIYQLKQTDT